MKSYVFLTEMYQQMQQRRILNDQPLPEMSFRMMEIDEQEFYAVSLSLSLSFLGESKCCKTGSKLETQAVKAAAYRFAHQMLKLNVSLFTSSNGEG